MQQENIVNNNLEQKVKSIVNMENLKLEKEFLIRWNVITQLEFVYVTRTGAFCYCCGKCFQDISLTNQAENPISFLFTVSLSLYLGIHGNMSLAYLLLCSDMIREFTSFAAWYNHSELRSWIFWKSPKFLLDQFYVLSLGSKVMVKQKAVAG